MNNMISVKVAKWGMITSLALILSFVESLIPFYFGIPGMKLGLCNIIVVILMYCASLREAFIVNIMRILLAGFLFGNPFSIIYSLAGGIVSFIVMWFLFRSELFSVTGTSMAGGFAHNMGQIAAAAVFLSSGYVFWYAPVLMVAGIITGILTGIISHEMILRIRTAL